MANLKIIEGTEMLRFIFVFKFQKTHEDSDSDDNEALALDAKESFGTDKHKPKHQSVKDRLGSRSNSVCSNNDDENDTYSEDEDSSTNVKSRLGQQPSSSCTESRVSAKERLGRQQGGIKERLGSSSIHRNSPVDPEMEDMATNLEHDKLESRIRKHQAESRDDRSEAIRINRKRRNEAQSRNQRDKVVQEVPLKHIDIDIEKPIDTIVAQILESLGEPEDKTIIFSKYS